jgi:predicted lipoprotein with Yx(FWY)xxD motif
MRRSLTRARLLALALAAAAAVSVVIVMSASAASTRPVVKTTKNAQLGKTILVTRKGFTLYSLSAETHGRFICTNKACLSFWTPLVVARGVKPTGAAKLATVKRPDGRIQVTYKGLPLYTFNDDQKPGDVNGNGFKDVGTWHPAVTSGTVKSSPPSNGGGYYGG